MDFRIVIGDVSWVDIGIGRALFFWALMGTFAVGVSGWVVHRVSWAGVDINVDLVAISKWLSRWGFESGPKSSQERAGATHKLY